MLWRITLAYSYSKCFYLFSNKSLQQGETNIKPSILEDIPVRINALIQNNAFDIGQKSEFIPPHPHTNI